MKWADRVCPKTHHEANSLPWFSAWLVKFIICETGAAGAPTLSCGNQIWKQAAVV